MIELNAPEAMCCVLGGLTLIVLLGAAVDRLEEAWRRRRG